jgi:hypothetical protein
MKDDGAHLVRQCCRIAKLKLSIRLGEDLALEKTNFTAN